MINIAKKSIQSVLMLIITASLAGCSGVKQNNGKIKHEIIKADLKQVRDGEYTGKYNININSARVLVTVKDGTIQKIEILKHHHGPGYGADSITEEVIKKQSLEVDVITGATKSSRVLLKAVENAIRQGM